MIQKLKIAKKNIMIYHICMVYEIALICSNQDPRGILEKKPHAMRLTVVRRIIR